MIFVGCGTAGAAAARWGPDFPEPGLRVPCGLGDDAPSQHWEGKPCPQWLNPACLSNGSSLEWRRQWGIAGGVRTLPAAVCSYVSEMVRTLMPSRACGITEPRRQPGSFDGGNARNRGRVRFRFEVRVNSGAKCAPPCAVARPDMLVRPGSRFRTPEERRQSRCDWVMRGRVVSKSAS